MRKKQLNYKPFIVMNGFSGIFYNYIVNKGKVRVKKFAEIYNYIVNKEKMYVKNERKSTTIYEI